MGEQAEKYAKSVISHYDTHAEAGKFVKENSVAYMVEEYMQDIKNGNFQKCSNEIMAPNLAALKNALEPYGVTNLTIVDSNHNHVVDKGDKIKMTVKEQGLFFSGDVDKEMRIGEWHGPAFRTESGMKKEDSRLGFKDNGAHEELILTQGSAFFLLNKESKVLHGKKASVEK
ncbi:MAG: hypothetical protein K2X77_21140 [Candidatus Obscuribacterales bacterium]|nr:hypothetical protein [Candidatus Obscuribacterales bacterium]